MTAGKTDRAYSRHFLAVVVTRRAKPGALLRVQEQFHNMLDPFGELYYLERDNNVRMKWSGMDLKITSGRRNAHSR